MREIRRQLRQLPRERRRDIGAAIRAGRAVSDPRDAALAAAWAEQLVAKARGWPSWVMPRTRPTGWRAWAWLLHLIWIVAAAAWAWVYIWPDLPGVWRWGILGFLVYGAISTPVTMSQMLRSYWNAPATARKNRELMGKARA